MGNDATLTWLIVEETDKVQNIKLSALKQNNIKSVFFFFLKSWVTKDKILNAYIVFRLFLPKILLALFEVDFAIPLHPREGFRGKISQFGTNLYVVDISL